MTIEDYKARIDENGFIEYPIFNDPNQLLSVFIDFEDTDIDLKIYLNKLILCRSFYGTYTAWYADVKWFTQNFYSHLFNDIIKPELTNAIREAAQMISGEEIFTKRIIATTFMFGIIEFYAKSKLGFRPMDYDFFDRKGKREYIQQLDEQNKNIDLTIKAAFEQLQLKELPISIALNEIDTFTTSRLSKAEIPSKNWTVHSIAERLHLARNPMLHGETHSFHSIGGYLLMLYSLFHLYDKKELPGSISNFLEK